MNDERFIEYLKRALAPTREVAIYEDYDPENPFDADWLTIGEYGVAKSESGKFLLTRGYEVSSYSRDVPPDYDFAECGEFSDPSDIAEVILTDDIKNRLDGLSETMAYEEECADREAEYAAGRL
jgi:hypothetical protein